MSCFLHGLACAPAFQDQGCGSAGVCVCGGGLEEINLGITGPERSCDVVVGKEKGAGWDGGCGE